MPRSQSSTSRMINLLNDVPKDLWINNIIPNMHIQDVAAFVLVSRNALALIKHFLNTSNIHQEEIAEAAWFSKLIETIDHIDELLTEQARVPRTNKIISKIKHRFTPIMTHVVSLIPGGYTLSMGAGRATQQKELLAQQLQAFTEWLATCSSSDARISREVCDDYAGMSKDWRQHVMQMDCNQTQELWDCAVKSCLSYVGYCESILTGNNIGNYYYAAGAALIVALPIAYYFCFGKFLCRNKIFDQELIASFLQKNSQQLIQTFAENNTPEQKKALQQHLEKQIENLRILSNTSEVISYYHLEYSNSFIIKNTLQEKISQKQYKNNKLFLFQWKKERNKDTVIDIVQNEDDESTPLLGAMCYLD